MKFFDKMKDSVSAVGTGVSQKVSYTADTIKLNNQIHNNDKEIEKLVYQIGLRCVKLHLDNQNSEYEELFVQIRHLQELNKTYQEELKAREQSRLNELETKHQVQEMPCECQEQISEKTKLCQNCNKRSDIDSKFCIHCVTAFPEDYTETGW